MVYKNKYLFYIFFSKNSSETIKKPLISISIILHLFESEIISILFLEKSEQNVKKG